MCLASVHCANRISQCIVSHFYITVRWLLNVCWCVCACAHTATCVCLCLRRHTCVYLISVHACKGCLHICVSTRLCLYTFLCLAVCFGVPAPRKCLKLKTASGCVMRAFLLWFGPILKCCQTLGLQRKICSGSAFTYSCVYMYINTWSIWVCVFARVCIFAHGVTEETITGQNHLVYKYSHS